jgi:hypothetical protein
MKTLNLDRLIEKAQKNYLLEGTETFSYMIRENKSVPYYYEELERELKASPFIKITGHKKVREGQVNVARVASIEIILRDYSKDFSLLAETRASFKSLIERFSHLQALEFINRFYSLCRKRHQVLTSCFEIYQYLQNHKDVLVGLLPRQIPHGESTKLLGHESILLNLHAFLSHRDSLTWDHFFDDFQLQTRSAEFRIYAPHCSWHGSPLIHFHGLISEELISSYAFCELKETLIIENLESFLPLVGAGSSSTLLVWGGGWRCMQLVPFIHLLPGKVFYWGDIDKEGVEIASLFCEKSGAHPVLMDMESFNEHKHLAEKVNYATPLRKITLLNDVYEKVTQENLRIEQEKIVLKIPLS